MVLVWGRKNKQGAKSNDERTNGQPWTVLVHERGSSNRENVDRRGNGYRGGKVGQGGSTFTTVGLALVEATETKQNKTNNAKRNEPKRSPKTKKQNTENDVTHLKQGRPDTFG